jgi:hypothetical protein
MNSRNSVSPITHYLFFNKDKPKSGQGQNLRIWNFERLWPWRMAGEEQIPKSKIEIRPCIRYSLFLFIRKFPGKITQTQQRWQGILVCKSFMFSFVILLEFYCK